MPMARRASRWRDFEPDTDLRMPPGRRKRLKLYADLSVPAPVVEELRAAGVSIECASGRRRAWRTDGVIHGEAKKSGRILLTMDRDFWKDRAYPLQQTAGIIFVDIPPSDLEGAVDGLALFYAAFAQHFPRDWWHGVKARVHKKGFVIKLLTWEGKIEEHEFALGRQGKLRIRSRR